MVSIVGHTDNMDSTLKVVGIILQLLVIYQPTLYNIEGPKTNDNISFKSS